MSKELEELVSFLHSEQPAVRQMALENVVGYTQGPEAYIFQKDDMRGVNDLKLLTRARQPRTVKLALSGLINLCEEQNILDSLASDEIFTIYVANSILEPEESNADLYCMLLANMAKNNQMTNIMKMKRKSTSNDFPSANVIDCLMDCFVKGSTRKLNKYADYDFLAFFFSDISRFEDGRKYFVTEQEYDHVVPLTKLLVFTENESKIRRQGVASTIKNVLFDVDQHQKLVQDPEINLLPYILLPIAGPEEFKEDEMLELPDELQFLSPDKKREPVPYILAAHVESLLLLCTTRKMREYLRTKSVYPFVRELHKAVDDEDVQDRCDRIVQMLMRDEVPEGEEGSQDLNLKDILADNENDWKKDDDDDEIVEVI